MNRSPPIPLLHYCGRHVKGDHDGQHRCGTALVEDDVVLGQDGSGKTLPHDLGLGCSVAATVTLGGRLFFCTAAAVLGVRHPVRAVARRNRH